jgi:hypothetical protein
VVRAGDLLVAEVELHNVRLSADGSRLSRIDAGQPAAIVLRLPTLHFREPVSGASYRRWWPRIRI